MKTYSVLLHTTCIVTFYHIYESENLIGSDVIQEDIIHCSIFTKSRTINYVDAGL